MRKFGNAGSREDIAMALDSTSTGAVSGIGTGIGGIIARGDEHWVHGYTCGSSNDGVDIPSRSCKTICRGVRIGSAKNQD